MSEKNHPRRENDWTLVLWKHLFLLIMMPKTGKLKGRFFLSLLMTLGRWILSAVTLFSVYYAKEKLLKYCLRSILKR